MVGGVGWMKGDVILPPQILIDEKRRPRLCHQLPTDYRGELMYRGRWSGRGGGGGRRRKRDVDPPQILVDGKRRPRF